MEPVIGLAWNPQLAIIDERARLLVGDPRMGVRLLRGTVAGVDGRTCAVHLGGAAVPTQGVRIPSEPAMTPTVGDEVIVARDLGGRTGSWRCCRGSGRYASVGAGRTPTSPSVSERRWSWNGGLGTRPSPRLAGLVAVAFDEPEHVAIH